MRASPNDAGPEPLPGARVGRFELVRVLGKGGMGVVFEARDVELGRAVALKMIGTPGREKAEKRFLREVQAVAKLQHPGIVSIYEVGRHEDRAWYAMALLRGRTFEQLIETGVSFERAAEVVRDAARAIHHAHVNGIVHRDVKPGNIMIEDAQADRHARVVVVDFGLARETQRETDALTRTGALIGTPHYEAPEQLRDPSNAGPPADVYGLGAVLYESLTGRPPYVADSLLELVSKIDTAPLDTPRSIRAEVPKPLEQICLRALAHDPAARYASADALALDLDRFLKGEPIGPKSGRGSRAVAIAAVIALALAASAAIAFAMRASPPPSSASASPPPPSANATASLERAAKLFAANDPSAEEAALRARAEAQPGSDGARLAARILGLARARRGDAKGALEPLESAERAGAVDAEVLATLARLENDLALAPERALAHADRAAALAPSLVAAHREAGRALERTGKKSEACARFEEALAASPRDAALLARVGSLQLELGRPERATKPLAAAIELNPDDAAARVALGRALYDLKDLPAAADAFRAALAVDPSRGDAKTGLAVALIDAGKFDEASTVLDLLVADEPANATAWRDLALARRRAGKLDLAATAIARARSLEPKNAEHAKEAGRLALARVDLAGAEAAFVEAIALAPEDADAALDLAAVLVRLDRKPEAIEALERAAARHPNDARVKGALRALGR